VQAHADRLDALCEDAYGTLYEEEAAVLSRLSHVFRCVGDMAAIDPMVVEQYDRREEVQAVLEDLALFLRDYRGGLAVTPGRLDEIESRLALIERLKKKYGATVGEVLAFADRCRGELQSLADPEGREKELEQRRDDWASRFVEQALALSVRRRVSAREMEERVCRELAQLAMEKARFEVRFSPTAAPDPSGGASELWSGRGLETAEFYLSPNPGEELRPLARIASGGELSRILHALKSVATLDEAGKTLVFDEVDAGIGGGVAEVVGRKLKAMAEANQVLCVTHLPQIAGQADQHLVIRKVLKAGRTTTEVRTVDGDDRVNELARMLGGETITEVARSHAREMMQNADRERPRSR
jgi:DNA repair protein RecN (Recombination protein N)